MFVDTTLQEAKRTNVVEHPGFNKVLWIPLSAASFAVCLALRSKAQLWFRDTGIQPVAISWRALLSVAE